jgi:outer membrane protein TolC
MAFITYPPMSPETVRGTALQRRAEPQILRFAAAAAVALLALALFSVRASAQQTGARAGAVVQLTLDDALRIAQQQSQTIEVARAGVTRANGQAMQARSQMLPQLNASAGYGRTLASQFSGLSATATPVDTTPKPIASHSLCSPLLPANATAADRAAALAQAATCPAASSSGSFDLSKTSFGAKNQYNVALAFSQNVYTGGRIQAQNQQAQAQVRSANIDVASQKAQVSLDVTSAYYDAVLADQLVAIADSSLSETEAVLTQTKLARQVGNTSEYDLLRAQVNRDNQVPVQIQSRSNRQVAYLRLKQLLELPLDDSVHLLTRLDTATGPTLPAIASGEKMDTVVSDRAPLRQMDEAVRSAEAQIKIARSERIPPLQIVSNYQRLYFPPGYTPTWNQGVNNWTVGLSTNFPVFDGGRIKGDQTIAAAGLAQAKAQREQTREFAALDTRVALNQLAEAEATWNASRGTVEQAQRAYAIDQVRLREGISTQTDLTQSRLALEQARANRAQAARNLAVARVRLALIKDLPIQATNAGGAASQQQQQQQQQAPSRAFTSTPSAAAGSSGTSGSAGGIQP